MAPATTRQQHANHDGDEGKPRSSFGIWMSTYNHIDRLEADSSKAWEIVDLTEPASPAYSPSDSTVISGVEDVPMESFFDLKTATKAKRTGLVPRKAAKLIMTRKSKMVVGKDSIAKKKEKKKGVLPEPRPIINKTTSKALSKASKSKKPEPKAALTAEASKTNEVIRSKKSAPKLNSTAKVSKVDRVSKSRSLYYKRSKAERVLEDVHKYPSGKSTAQEANKAGTKPAAGQLIPDKIKLVERELKRAEERALRARTSADSAIRERYMADCDVAVAAGRVRVAKMSGLSAHQNAEDVVIGDGIPELQGARIGYEAA